MKKTTHAKHAFASLLLALALTLGTLASCGTKDSGSAKTLRIGLDSDILRLDPAFAYDFTTNPVINQITQGLMYFDQNSQLKPLIASSWSIPDPLTYIYQIRSDVKFSDGTPMTMDDVVYSLNRHLDPKVNSLLNGQFESVESMAATGEWELTVKLKFPDATFINVLAGTPGHVVQKAYCEAQGEKFGSSEVGLIGTGPYCYELGSWKSGASLTLVKNENYWLPEDAGYYDRLDIRVIKEESTRVTSLQNGDIDVVTLPPAGLLDTLYADTAHVQMYDQPGFGLVYMAFNTQKKPFDDPRIHWAVAYGVDFASINANLVKRAGAAPTVLPFSDAMFVNQPERWNAYLEKAPKIEYNPEKARELLKEAGYENTLVINLMTNQDGLRASICVAIQEQLAQVGVKVNIVTVNGDEHTSYQFGDILGDDGLRGYDILMAGWSADFPDINGCLKPLFLSGQTANAAAYSNPALDALINAQLQESDIVKRNDILFDCMDIITTDMPYLIAFYPLKTYATSTKITGLADNASWISNVHFQDARPVDAQ